MKWRQYVVIAKKFYLDNGFLNASALTFYTLFAVVPILAGTIGIARGFGLDNFLNVQLEKAFPGQEEVIQFLSQYATNLLAQGSGELITGIAALILFYSIYSMLCHIERALNQIWQVPKPRRITSRISNYFSLILIAPMILILAGSLRLFITKIIPEYNLVLVWLSNMLSFLLVIFLFAWLYKYMPNTKVKSDAAIFGGVHAGIAYFLIQSLLIQSQIFMTNYNAIYGSLAVLPIFLIWVQASWVIVLFGAQLCFAYQNNLQAIWETDLNSLSMNMRQRLLLRITQTCIVQFHTNKPALTVLNIADELHMSVCITMQLINQLLQANILVETTRYNGEVGYQPAKNTDLLNDNYVLEETNKLGIMFFN